MNASDPEELRRVAQLLLNLAATSPRDPAQKDLDLQRPPSSIKMSDLASMAKKEMRARHLREEYLPRDLFAEGGWNVLLDLFVAEVEKTRVSITDACIASNLPTTTALRHIHLLVERALVERRRDPNDGRREFLRLTREGLETMCATLEAMVTLDVALSAKEESS